MSDFLVDIRTPRVHTYCEDAGPDDFVAELRTRQLDLDTHRPVDMELSYSQDTATCASDEELLGLLMSKQFSSEKMTELLRGSILTLIRKLLVGRRIGQIDGNIEVSLLDEQGSPISINFGSAEKKRNPASCKRAQSLSPVASDIDEDLNVRLRHHVDDGEMRHHPDYHHGSYHPSEYGLTSLKCVGDDGPRFPVYPGGSHDAASLYLDQPYQYPRRESDADSGYGCRCKSVDAMETGDDAIDADNISRLVPGGEERHCPSADSAYSVLEPDLRYKRESSCEKVTPGSLTPTSDRGHRDSGLEDLDDEEGPALIIDESYDADTARDATTIDETAAGGDDNRYEDKEEEKEKEEEEKSCEQMDQVNDATLKPACDDRRPACDVDCAAAPAPGESSLPVDLSGDSKIPSGSLTAAPRAVCLQLCAGASSRGLVCGLCHVILPTDRELARHALTNHQLFSCTRCFTSFSARSHLEEHFRLQACENFDIKSSGQRSGPEAQDDELFGQLLDLSMKKKTPTEREDETSRDAMSNQVVDARRGEITPAGETLPSDGYGQTRPGSLPLIPGMTSNGLQNNSPMSERHRGFDNQTQPGIGYEKDKTNEVRIKFEPATEAPFSPATHLPHDRDLLVVPRVVRCKSELPEEDRPASGEVTLSPVKSLQRKILSRSNSNAQDKATLRFSPYSRERLAELAAKFLATRRDASGAPQQPNAQENKSPIPETGSSPAAPPHRGPGDTPTLCQATATKLNGEIPREASSSETTLKNRVSAFVKSGGHQANTGGASEASNSPPAGASTKAEHSPAAGTDLASQGPPGGSSSAPHVCGQAGCGMRFASYQALERHSVDAHGRYLCEHCPKTFTARPNRDRHVRYHTGERPYKCDLCPKAFFRGDDLKYHRTTRHPTAEPFVCSRCGRNFTWSRDLERHVRHARCKI